MTETAAALTRAQEHCFMAGVGDAGEALCAANMAYGIAKIHHVQAALGLPRDATFVGAPDATVTRNDRRWAQGFGYGGRVQWTGDFAVLDIKNNACGMIAVELSDDPPSPSDIEATAARLTETPLVIDGVEIEFDLGVGNHFLDLCRQTGADPEGPPTHAIIHTSGHENRSATPQGLGIYYDESDELMALAERFDTPWGDLHVLRGADAGRWYGIYRWAEDFALARRERLARELLGDITVVCNRTHQGLRAMNDAILGCYCFDEADLAGGQRFPLTLGPDLPAYLVVPKRNMSTDTLERVGFAERAERYGLVDRLTHVNLLPHGGGYSYSQYAGVSRVIEDGATRKFEMRTVSGETELVSDVRGSAYGYRGDEVRERLVELELGAPTTKMDITFVLRT